MISTVVFVAMWEWAKLAMGWYIYRSFSNYSAVYGTFAILALTGVWIYLSAMLFTACACFGQACRTVFPEAMGATTGPSSPAAPPPKRPLPETPV